MVPLRAVGVLALFMTTSASLEYHALPVVEANDNRTPAGVVENGTLRVNLVVRMARWYPEAPDGPFAEVAAFAEVGKAPQIPAPLIRVREGTDIEATIRNDLGDSTVWIGGMMTRPGVSDSVPVRPGQTITLRFRAGAPGTYLYRGILGKSIRDEYEREQLAGAFVIDAPNADTDDRIVVINIWGDSVKSGHYRNVLALNGKSWPNTERISASTGDSVRWRVINASVRAHPMHMHGFYFRVDARGNSARDSVFAADERRLVVTEVMQERTTMSMVWSPDRPGNWLFHCHFVFHVADDARLDAKEAAHSHDNDADMSRHMAGLVMGITVHDSGKPMVSPTNTSLPVQKLRLYVNERKSTGPTGMHMSYVLQRGSMPPARDSVEPPGAVIVLTRGQPTEITVINQSHAPTSVHWHGLELESYSDGVAGWSGIAAKLAPMVAPADSFKANLTLARSGTFIYHTHINDLEQLTSGAYGAIVVLEPGEKLDEATDHTMVLGWNGYKGPPNLLLNGDSVLAPLELAVGRKHRLRFVNIGAAVIYMFALRKDSLPVMWVPRAKDGADLPPGLRVAGRAMRPLGTGETFDAEFTPTERGEYQLTINSPFAQGARTRRVIVH